MEPIFYRSPYGYYPPNRFMPSLYRSPNYYNNSYTKHTNYNYNCDNGKKKNNSSSNKANTVKKETLKIENQKPIFEIFGIKLFFDDLLLISLIFFLYSEGVQDQSLFIALILLLLSWYTYIKRRGNVIKNILYFTGVANL